MEVNCIAGRSIPTGVAIDKSGVLARNPKGLRFFVSVTLSATTICEPRLKGHKARRAPLGAAGETTKTRALYRGFDRRRNQGF